MIKVSVFYPHEEGKKFDMDYYLATHIPMVKRLLGPACTNTAVDQGLAGGAPGSEPPYRVIGHLYFNTIEDFMSSFGPNAAQITGDVPNYTDIAPVIQINQVKL